MKVFCPHCGQEYNATEKHLNKTICCQVCKQNFQVTDKRRCPACGEEILAIAKKCRFCGENLEPPEKTPKSMIAIGIVAGLIIVGIVGNIIAMISSFANEGGAALPAIGFFIGAIIITVTVFVIAKICEIARNTRK